MDPTQWETYRSTFDTTIPMTIFHIKDVADITEKDIENAHKLLKYYVGSVEKINEDSKDRMVKMFNDATFLSGIHNKIRYNFFNT